VSSARTSLAINKIVKTLRPLHTATITLGGQQITAEQRIPATAKQILYDLARGGHYRSLHGPCGRAACR
jgi:hypothetical protein